MPKDIQYLTITDAAKQLRVTRQTVYTLLANKRLAQHHVAGLRFVVADIAFRAVQAQYRKARAA